MKYEVCASSLDAEIDTKNRIQLLHSGLLIIFGLLKNTDPVKANKKNYNNVWILN